MRETGQRITSFGKGGIVDLKLEDDQEMDPDHRRHRPARRADHRERRRHHRRRAHRGQPSRQPPQRQGIRPRLRRAHREAAVDLPHHPAPGRDGVRHLGAGLRRVHGEQRRLGADERRRGARPRLPPDRDADRRLLRWASPGQEPVQRQPRRSGSEDRQAQVALPVHRARHLGLGSALRADPRRRHDRRPAAEDHRAADQAGLALRVRSCDGRTDLAVRRAQGRSVGRAGGEGESRRRSSSSSLPHTSVRVWRSTI